MATTIATPSIYHYNTLQYTTTVDSAFRQVSDRSPGLEWGAGVEDAR